MVKPLGNLLANKKVTDKISGKTQARFASKAVALPASSVSPVAVPAAARPVRFKKRKR